MSLTVRSWRLLRPRPFSAAPRQRRAISSNSYNDWLKTSPAGSQPHVFHSLKPPSVPRRKIKVYPPVAGPVTKDPVGDYTALQLASLDPAGKRQALLSRHNKDGLRPGDILQVRKKDGQSFAGVLLNIRRRGVDSGILLRNQLTRVGVEMWFKVFSPSVVGIDVVRRRDKRVRRAKLYYMRKPKHDIGSVQKIVTQYVQQRAILRGEKTQGAKGRKK